MTTSIKRQFERAFAGPINAGLRKEKYNVRTSKHL